MEKVDANTEVMIGDSTWDIEAAKRAIAQSQSDDPKETAMASKYEARLSDEGVMRWVGAGGPAYYLQGSQPSRVVAILYWTDADPAEAGTRPEVSPPGWRVVFTHNGEVWDLDLPAFDASADRGADAQVDAAVEAATRLIEVEL